MAKAAVSKKPAARVSNLAKAVQSTVPETESYWIYPCKGMPSVPVPDGGNPFLCSMKVCRKNGAGEWASNCLTLTPKKDQWGRWDLWVKAAGKRRSLPSVRLSCDCVALVIALVVFVVDVGNLRSKPKAVTFGSLRFP